MNNLYKYWFTAVIGLQDGNKYFMGKNYPGLFSWNEIGNEVIIIDDMSKKETCSDMYINGIQVDSKLYFAPWKADEYAVYDLKKKEIEYRKLYSDEVASKYNNKLINNGHYVISGMEKIYFINRDNPLIVVLSLRTNVLSYIETGFYGTYLELAHNRNGQVYYFTNPKSNHIYIFDVKTELFKKIILDEIEYPISSCLDDDNKLLLTSIGDNKVYIYELNDSSIASVNINICRTNELSRKYIHKYKENYYLLPLVDFHDTNEICVMDEQIGKIEYIDVFGVYSEYIKISLDYIGDCRYVWYALIKKDNTIDPLSCTSDVVYGRVDLLTLKMDILNLPLPKGISKSSMSEKIENTYWLDYIKNNSFLLEGNQVGLQRFIDYVGRESII